MTTTFKDILLSMMNERYDNSGSLVHQSHTIRKTILHGKSALRYCLAQKIYKPTIWLTSELQKL